MVSGYLPYVICIGEIQSAQDESEIIDLVLAVVAVVIVVVVVVVVTFYRDCEANVQCSHIFYVLFKANGRFKA